MESVRQSPNGRSAGGRRPWVAPTLLMITPGSAEDGAKTNITDGLNKKS